MKKTKGLSSGKLCTQAVFITVMLFMVLIPLGCTKQFEKLEENQAQLQTMIQTNAEQLAMITEYIGNNKAELTAKIDKVENETKTVADNLTAVNQQQIQLHKTTQNSISQIAGDLSVVAQNQEVLKSGLVVSHNETAQLANDLAQFNREQSQLHKTTQNSISQVAGNISQVAKNQEILKTEIAASDKETANGLAAIDQKQNELYNTVQNNNNKITERIVALDKEQGSLMAGIEESKNKTAKVSSEIASLARGQASLMNGMKESKRQTAKASSEIAALVKEQSEFHNTTQGSINQISENLTTVVKNQEVIKTDIAVSRNETTRVANNLSMLNKEQKELNTTFKSNNNNIINERLIALENGQNSLLAGMEESKSQTATVSSEVAALGREQSKLYETTQNGINQIADDLTEIASNQEIIKTGIVISQNETAAVAGSIASAKTEQLKIQQATQDNIDLIAGYISEVARNQEIMKAGFVVSHNETAKVANNVSELGEIQAQFSKAMQKDTQQLSDRVAVVEKGQQDWNVTMSQMQKSIQEAAGNINNFEKNLTELNQIFQAGLGQLISSAGIPSKEQLEFQEKMKKDFVALTESVNVIKKSQSQLQKHIQDVESSTELISTELPAAIEELRKEINDEPTTAYSIDE